jgi:hypothetical protein
MRSDRASLPYQKFVALVDQLFEESGDDVGQLSHKIEVLDQPVREELLTSDLLNAFQVFFYFFRTVPDDLVCERLELEPASALISGLKVGETDLLVMFFLVRDSKPLIIISDGDQAVATFSGNGAYVDGKNCLENPEYR